MEIRANKRNDKSYSKGGTCCSDRTKEPFSVFMEKRITTSFLGLKGVREIPSCSTFMQSSIGRCSFSPNIFIFVTNDVSQLPVSADHQSIRPAHNWNVFTSCCLRVRLFANSRSTIGSKLSTLLRVNFYSLPLAYSSSLQ